MVEEPTRAIDGSSGTPRRGMLYAIAFIALALAQSRISDDDERRTHSYQFQVNRSNSR